MVALASKDEVAPAEAVRAYVEHASKIKPAGIHQHKSAKGNVELIWWQDSFHGKCLLSSSFTGELMDTTRRQEEKLGLKSPRILDLSYSTSTTSTSHHPNFRLTKDYHED